MGTQEIIVLLIGIAVGMEIIRRMMRMVRHRKGPSCACGCSDCPAAGSCGEKKKKKGCL